MSKLILSILLCICNICSYAQINKYQANGKIQIENIVLSECLNKNIEERNEIFSCDRSNDGLWNIVHKDVLVKNSGNNIDVKVSYSNDSIFIREIEIRSEEKIDSKCLKDLSYQIKVNRSDYDTYAWFVVLSSDVCSDSYQVFLPNVYTTNEYPVTKKSDYQYEPFIMDGTCEWLSTYHVRSYSKYVITSADTLIQDKTYKKILSKGCTSDNEIYYGAIQEENKRIYFIPEASEIGMNEGDEVLLYDFNMKVGDYIAYPWHDESVKVAHIDTVRINGDIRRRFYFYHYDSYYEKLKIDESNFWIEGVGNNIRTFMPFPPIPTCIDCDLRVHCVHQGEKVLYRDNDSSPCNCNEEQSIGNSTQDDSFCLLQNPIKDKCLSMKLNDSTFTKIDIYSWNGKLLLTKEISVSNGILEFSLTSLQPGNYILILSRPDNSRESCKVIIQ